MPIEQTAAKPKTKGAATRERILAVAESLVLRQGYSGTSIDDILCHAHITKGGFFYHFDGKNDLALALLQRYQTNDREFFQRLTDQAHDLVEDPLQRLLLFLKLLADAMANLEEVHPGCLVATFCYESQQVNDDVKDINREVLEEWREMFCEHFQQVDEKYASKMEVDAATLADTLTSIIEGGIIISKAMNDQQLLADQILQYRNYIKLLYGID